MDALAAAPSTRWSTHGVAERDRFAFWREIICAAYVRLDARPVDGGPFDGAVDLSAWDAVQVSLVRAGGQVVTRAPDGDDDTCLVSIQQRGTGRVTQAGRTAVLQPGDLALYDASQPYQLAFDDPFDQVVVKFPERLLRVRNVDAEAVAARRIDGSSGLGRIASTFARSLADAGGGVDDAVRGRLGEQALDLLAVALAGSVGGAAVPEAARAAERQRILAHVDAHLTDPDLTITAIARAFRRSPRSLQKLFAEGGGQPLGDRIRQARLARAAAALHDPVRDGQPISRIGADCGYPDPVTFAKAFRARYGCPPSAYRRQG